MCCCSTFRECDSDIARTKSAWETWRPTDRARDTPNSHLLSLSLSLSVSLSLSLSPSHYPRSFQLVLKRWHDRGDVRRGDKVLPKPGVSVSQSLTPTNCPTEQTNERKQKEADPEWPYKKSCMGLSLVLFPHIKRVCVCVRC